MKPATIPSVLVSVRTPIYGQRVIFETRYAVYIGIYKPNSWSVFGDDTFEDYQVISWAPSPYLSKDST
jgi:hypothetical protein